MALSQVLVVVVVPVVLLPLVVGSVAAIFLSPPLHAHARARAQTHTHMHARAHLFALEELFLLHGGEELG